MKHFSYSARNETGRLQTGELDAESAGAAAAVIVNQGLIPVEIKPAKNSLFFERTQSFFGRSQHCRFAALFFRRLSVMIGVAEIYKIAALCAENESNKRYRAILTDISHQTETGTKLSDAMRPYEDIFSPLAVQMIDLCYKSGGWDKVLPPLADLTEKIWQRQENMRANLFYPLVLAMMLIVASVVVIAFVLPSFAGLFAELDAELPLPTQMLLAFGEFAEKYGALSLAALLVLLAAFNMLLQKENFRRRIDGLRLQMPLFGTLERENEWARILNAMSVLTEGGFLMD